jgi:hypothetical protein
MTKDRDKFYRIARERWIPVPFPPPTTPYTRLRTGYCELTARNRGSICAHSHSAAASEPLAGEEGTVRAKLVEAGVGAT